MARCVHGPTVSATSTPRSASARYCATVCSRNRSCQPPTSRVGTVERVERRRRPLVVPERVGEVGVREPRPEPGCPAAEQRVDGVGGRKPVVRRRQPPLGGDAAHDRREQAGRLLVQDQVAPARGSPGTRTPRCCTPTPRSRAARRAPPRRAAPAAGRPSASTASSRGRRRRRWRAGRRTTAARAATPRCRGRRAPRRPSGRTRRPSRTCPARSAPARGSRGRRARATESASSADRRP